MVKRSQNPKIPFAVLILNVSLFSPVINVTLPDEKQNYVHRIGRVGRAERSEFRFNDFNMKSL